MKLIVGLGNPGKEYEKTRHNTGFMIAEGLKETLNFNDFGLDVRFNGYISSGLYKNEKLLLIKPATFMNKSGESVSSIKNFFKVENKDIWLIYDDIDLPLGILRIRSEGTGGTHNGVKSIIKYLGEDLPRFRIGIESRGKFANINQQTESFVLDNFKSGELEVFNEVKKSAEMAVIEALENGITSAMNKYNKRNT